MFGKIQKKINQNIKILLKNWNQISNSLPAL
jgi:hypothetical protein